MIREIVFPLRMRSGNVLMRRHWGKNHSETAEARKYVKHLLRAHFPDPRVVIDGRPNVFTVTLTRIACRAGLGMDKHDRLRLAFAGVVDEIAAWLTLDDGDTNQVKWLYEREENVRRGVHRVRLKIEDFETLRDVRKELDDRPEEPDAQPKPPRRKDRSRRVKVPEQRHLVFKPAHAAFPWEQEPNDDEWITRDVGHLVTLLNAPAAFKCIAPTTGREVTLWRHEHFDRSLGGDVWLYTDERPQIAVAAPGKERHDH